MRFFRWRHWRASAKYWRKRALKAEASLEAEIIRNREREDTLITVPMRLGGLWGMPARTAPAVKQVNPIPALARTTDPWDSLTWADKQEFDMFWKADAAAAGVSEHEARQKFLLELQNRRVPVNDEPYGAN